MAEDPTKRASPLQVVKAVFWSFLGIRRRAEHESDVVRLSLVQVVVAGLLGAAIFVAVLILIVRVVVNTAAQ